MIRFLFLNLLFISAAFAQSPLSTVRGTVSDRDTGIPLASASITLSPSGQGATSDSLGHFRFDQLPFGRYSLTISYLGYEQLDIHEILLEAGKEQVLDIKLIPAGIQLASAEVQGNRALAVNSVQAITPEQTLRYAATYLDPARVATSFPGVAAANDQANGLVIRGNSPNSMQWRLEGVEIVNPNHLSNAGTFNDRATQTGGGVNILSTQLLGTSYIYTGAFPAQYGNALAGVMDMNFRNGNNEKREFTMQAGLIGIDLAAEGPLSKTSKASYLINYRYSFTGLLGLMGIKFGGEAIRFQDLSFKISIPTTRYGEFSLFGMGGLSKNSFKTERDTLLWEYQKDRYDIYYSNQMGATGITHRISLGRKTSWSSALVGSGLSTSREEFRLTPSDNYLQTLDNNDAQSRSIWSFTSAITYRPGNKTRLKAGFFVNRRRERLQSIAPKLNDLDRSMTGYTLQPYFSLYRQLTPQLSTELGINYTYYGFSQSHSLEPRGSLKWQATPRQSFSASYGLHSQAQTAQVCFAQPPGATEATPLQKPGPTKAHHFVLGYQNQPGRSSVLKIEAYLQYLFQVPIAFSSAEGPSPQSATFSALNAIESRLAYTLTNSGTGRNYGIELSYQKFLSKSYYLMVSGSLYNSTYEGYDHVRHSTRYNGNHTFSLTTGKEFNSGRKSTWGVNMRILWLGGFRDNVIDEARSLASQTTIYNYEKPFSVKMKDYFRPDLRIYWKKNHTHYSRTLALDIQNLSGTQNEAYSYFDTLRGKMIKQYQLGLIPVISYRWEF